MIKVNVLLVIVLEFKYQLRPTGAMRIAKLPAPFTTFTESKTPNPEIP